MSVALETGLAPPPSGLPPTGNLAPRDVETLADALLAYHAEFAPLFRRAKGCTAMVLQRSVEKPARYRLFVTWETVENHTVDFRGSPDFAEWRKLVGHCFASPPDVEHVHEVVKGF